MLAVVTPLATQLQGAVAPAIFQTCTILCLIFGYFYGFKKSPIHLIFRNDLRLKLFQNIKKLKDWGSRGQLVEVLPVVVVVKVDAPGPVEAGVGGAWVRVHLAPVAPKPPWVPARAGEVGPT